ncbi:MAG TPA: metalloregulator ArsR/SmtB family transcription factor [Anaerolineales bacterium]|nr:metalloregulator ArsR/SmtB family transcription factor [Anaerolineales bacterium]
MENELVDFYKALGDASRLKIVGLLAGRAYSVEELAALLHLRPSTVSHHLSKLTEVGLVSAHPESYYNVYHLEQKALEAKTRRLLSRADFGEAAAAVDLDAYDRKVVADYTRRDGSLKTIPAQQKKLEATLRYIVKAFEPGKRYSERQVNKILARFHADTASLRRELVGHKLMKRAVGGGDYWRTES